MPATLTVIYPHAADATFDMDYYLKTHMPMVEKAWKQHGLKSWQVTQLAGQGGSPPAYTVQATLQWESVDQIAKVESYPETAGVMADVPNFSNKQPVIIGGEVVGAN